jgi:hypothetical protein
MKLAYRFVLTGRTTTTALPALKPWVRDHAEPGWDGKGVIHLAVGYVGGKHFWGLRFA